MPVSATPTVTAVLPCVTSHASGASTSASGVPATPFTVWPVLCSPHRSENDESFGVVETGSAM